jgi:glycosyltransferase involved in cell wall biosynthesis
MAICRRVSIIGTVGLPANYGGFETLVENLVKQHHQQQQQQQQESPVELTVYCSSRIYKDKPDHFLSARLRYLPLQANGVQSIFYDAVSLFSALWHGSDTILLLGVSGALALPLIRRLSRVQIVTNIDGIEWRRDKWQGLAKRFLKWSEAAAVHHSHEVVADNDAIADYVRLNYGKAPHVIAYGGDHAVQVQAAAVPAGLPVDGYDFAVCRIEPENNVQLALQAYADLPDQPLVFVGNWHKSAYGRDLRAQYAGCTHLYLLDPIYDLGILKSLRMHARCYVHGHSAGGTNPSLVEAMHFGLPILAYDCDFNRCTTEGKALYFKDVAELTRMAIGLDDDRHKQVGPAMLAIARRRYTWETVARQYAELGAA